MFEVRTEGNIFGVFLVRKGIPGIVNLKGGEFYCGTCKKSYCDHAQYLTDLKETDNIPPVVARLMSSVVQSSVSGLRRQSIFSNKSVSFSPTEEMGRALKKLCLADQFSSLSPSTSVSCSCGNNTYVASVLNKDADLITLTSLSKV